MFIHLYYLHVANSVTHIQQRFLRPQFLKKTANPDLKLLVGLQDSGQKLLPGLWG